MVEIWQRILAASRSLAPEGSTYRKLIQITAIVLFFQGVSIAILSSHLGPALGVLSMVLGILLLFLFPPNIRLEDTGEGAAEKGRYDANGIRLVEFVVRCVGGPIGVMMVGAVIIVGVLLHNSYVSARPDIGDLDLLSIILGGLLVAYPFAWKRAKVEMCFAILFLVFVVVILVLPQAIMSFNSGSSLNNWYVHYMLAAPFANVLNLLGIPASVFIDSVSITFRDGTVHTLGISTACAGLYSFSIFVSAFFSFVLVFERLPVKIMSAVLALGLLVAYLGNLVRMIVIGVIGYYHGIDALLWAHANVGWIVFLSWSSVFWYAVMRFADTRKAH